MTAPILDGSVAVVTGSGRGIGRAEALHLAALGAAVVVNDLGTDWDGVGVSTTPADRVVAEIEAGGGRAISNHEDISTWNGAEALITHAMDEFGRVDIVVNNAGILRDRALIQMTEDDWDAVLRCHLYGHAAVTQHACRQFLRGRRRGRIINTTSESAFYGLRGQANYAAAKAGIIALTLVTSVEMGPFGITANAIAPRARTRLITQSLGDTVMAADPGQFDEFAPENVAPLVGYLASPEAGHVSGRCFVVSGASVEIVEGWQTVDRIQGDGRWTADRLAQQMDALLGVGATST